MSTVRKILSNTAVQVLGRAIMAGASIVILRLITGFFSTAEYGMYASIYEFLAFFAIVADLGLFTIAVREMSKTPERRSFIVQNLFTMRFCLAIGTMLLAIASGFALAAVGHPSFSGNYIPVGIAIASIGVFFTILQGIVSSVLQVELKMQHATMGIVLGKLITLAWMIAVIRYFYVDNVSAAAFYQLMVAGVVGNAFALAYNWFYARRYAELRLAFDWDYWREIFRTSLPYGLAIILNMVYFRVDTVMILFLKDEATVAFYGPAMRILEILSMVFVYFMNSVLPQLSQAVQKGGELLKRTLELSMAFLIIMGVPILVGTYLLAYPVIAFISNNPELLSDAASGHYGSDAALQLLAFAMFFAYINSLFIYSLIASNRQNHLLWINGSAALFNVVANFYAISMFSFRGAAFTSVITELYILVVAWLMVRKHLPFVYDGKLLAKVVASAGVMGVVIWQLRWPAYDYFAALPIGINVSVLALGVLGATIYGGMLYALGGIPKGILAR